MLSVRDRAQKCWLRRDSLCLIIFVDRTQNFNYFSVLSHRKKKQKHKKVCTHFHNYFILCQFIFIVFLTLFFIALLNILSLFYFFCTVWGFFANTFLPLTYSTFKLTTPFFYYYEKIQKIKRIFFFERKERAMAAKDEQQVSDDDRDTSPVSPLPIYQQRDNFFS